MLPVLETLVTFLASAKALSDERHIGQRLLCLRGRYRAFGPRVLECLSTVRDPAHGRLWGNFYPLSKSIHYNPMAASSSLVNGKPSSL